jgi:hypothetical protein
MTIARRNATFQPPFNQWLQRQADLDSRNYRMAVADNDLLIHKYSSRIGKVRYEYEMTTDNRDCIDHLMQVEVKAFMSELTNSQEDSLYLLDAVLRAACAKNGRRRYIEIPDRRMPSFIRHVRCYGVHVLTLSGADPDTSDQMFWDETPITQHQLIEILRFDRDPDSPMRMMDTRIHHVPKRNTLGELLLAAA